MSLIIKLHLVNLRFCVLFFLIDLPSFFVFDIKVYFLL